MSTIVEMVEEMKMVKTGEITEPVEILLTKEILDICTVEIKATGEMVEKGEIVETVKADGGKCGDRETKG